MRNKIRYWLIQLANKIGDKGYYDFGDEVVGLVVVKDKLYCATKGSIFAKNKTDDKFKRVSSKQSVK